MPKTRLNATKAPFCTRCHPHCPGMDFHPRGPYPPSPSHRSSPAKTSGTYLAGKCLPTERPTPEGRGGGGDPAPPSTGKHRREEHREGGGRSAANPGRGGGGEARRPSGGSKGQNSSLFFFLPLCPSSPALTWAAGIPNRYPRGCVRRARSFSGEGRRADAAGIQAPGVHSLGEASLLNGKENKTIE